MPPIQPSAKSDAHGPAEALLAVLQITVVVRHVGRGCAQVGEPWSSPGAAKPYSVHSAAPIAPAIVANHRAKI
jgi:hypothetical protein